MPTNQAPPARSSRPDTAGCALPRTDRNLGLDLLRAIAISMVLVSHWSTHIAGWFAIPVPEAADVLGDVGVELFFALSGFLIGRILIDMVRRRPTWRDFGLFALRRALRTLPLYYIWLSLLLVLFPPQHDGLAEALRFASLSQNLFAAFPPDYYFAVTWSLTIEIWFYLLFGLAVVLHARRMPGSRALTRCVVLFLVIPLLLRLGYAERGSLVFLRIDEIAYGVIAAMLYTRRHWLFQHPWPLLLLGVALNALTIANWLPVPARLLVPLTSNIQVIGCALCLPAALRLTHAPGWIEAPCRWLAGR